VEERVPNNEFEAALRSSVDSFPLLPGVYIMKDVAGTVVYVGKALELRTRVRSYLRGGDGRVQIPALMERVRTIENVVTASEQQAFILERDLIQRYKPRYNIRLKDDRAYYLVRVDLDHEWPRLQLTRRRADDGARYYGPFHSSTELRIALDVIKKTIPLRTCSDPVLYNRTRPCLEHQIKRCCAPCCLPVKRADYMALVRQASGVLQGKISELQSELEGSMEKASAELRFEDAADLRDRIETLRSLREGQRLSTWSGDDKDVFGIHREETLAVISLLQIRDGRLHEGNTFEFSDVVVENGAILEACISQFYSTNGRDIPAEIVVPFLPDNVELTIAGLKQRRGDRVEIIVPERGVRARLIDLAQTNARTAFASTFNAAERYQAVAQALALKCGLRQMPRRIECVDISNFQGSDTVGAIVSFFDGGPDKQRYRKFKISGREGPDDFASIYEVVSRRLKRGKEQQDLPDLLIVDGGEQQLRRAIQARDELALDLEIVSLAKQRTMSDAQGSKIEKSNERIFVSGSQTPIELSADEELTKLVTRIRDEAHRFVITFHRNTRSKRVVGSQLDQIPGLSRESSLRLLKHFGSVGALAGVDELELAKVGRMSKAIARKVRASLTPNDKA
jgi:excinuclease ABC subunit C